MSNVQKLFKRKETKYQLSFQQYEQIQQELLQQMEQTEYGKHTICSLYYDTKHYDLIQQSIEKPFYKEKFRVRSYGVPMSNQDVFLEIKKKMQGIVYKRRMALPFSEFTPSLELPPKTKFVNPIDQQIQQEINWFKRKYSIEPKVMICYDRLAYFGKEDAEFRITFDFNIRYRTDQLDLENGDFGERVAPELDVLMEVKALGAYPIWFSHLLSKEKIYPSSFSKYAQVYQRYLLNQGRVNHAV